MRIDCVIVTDGEVPQVEQVTPPSSLRAEPAAR